jgi:hypothetical protein
MNIPSFQNRADAMFNTTPALKGDVQLGQSNSILFDVNGTPDDKNDDVALTKFSWGYGITDTDGTQYQIKDGQITNIDVDTGKANPSGEGTVHTQRQATQADADKATAILGKIENAFQQNTKTTETNVSGSNVFISNQAQNSGGSRNIAT